MRSFGIVLGLLGAINGFAIPAPAPVPATPLHRFGTRDVETNTTKTAPISGRFIVEFAKVSIHLLPSYCEPLINISKGVDATAAAAELTASGAKILKVFNSDVFSGVTIESGDENIDTLQAKNSVYQAWQSQRYYLGPITPASSYDYSELATSGNYSVHDMTGVDKLHAAGITGKGAKVAIVDTGVDYNHIAVRNPSFVWSLPMAVISMKSGVD